MGDGTVMMMEDRYGIRELVGDPIDIKKKIDPFGEKKKKVVKKCKCDRCDLCAAFEVE